MSFDLIKRDCRDCHTSTLTSSDHVDIVSSFYDSKPKIKIQQKKESKFTK